MPEFISGPNMVLTWQHSGGTANLATAYTTCTWTPAVDFVDVSSGADTHHVRLTALKDCTAAITMYEQTGGSVLATALTAGAAGTLIIGPEGTNSGKRKITVPGYSGGASYSYPFADKAEMNVTITGNGAYTDSTY